MATISAWVMCMYDNITDKGKQSFILELKKICNKKDEAVMIVYLLPLKECYNIECMKMVLCLLALFSLYFFE